MNSLKDCRYLVISAIFLVIHVKATLSKSDNEETSYESLPECKENEFSTKDSACTSKYYYCFTMLNKPMLVELTCPKGCCFKVGLSKCVCNEQEAEQLRKRGGRLISSKVELAPLSPSDRNSRTSGSALGRRLSRKGDKEGSEPECKDEEFTTKDGKCTNQYYYCLTMFNKRMLAELSCPKGCCFNLELSRCVCHEEEAKRIRLQGGRMISSKVMADNELTSGF